MAIDLSKLSNTDLKALRNKDFKSISDEGLKILRPPSPEEKFQEQKQIVSRITPQSPIGVPGGIATPPIPGTLEQAKAGVFENMNEAGELIAEGLASGPLKTNPKLAAAVGTMYQVLPDVILSTIPLGGRAVKAAKVPVKAAKAVGKAVKETKLGKAIRFTGAKEVERLTEKKAIEAVKSGEKAEVLGKLKKEAGEAIGEAEKALGIDISKIPSRGLKAIAKGQEGVVRFADRVSRLANKGAKKLAEIGDPKQLQFFRKAAEEALEKGKVSLTKSAQVKLFQAKKAFTEAISLRGKQFKEAMSRFDDVQKIINKLPAEKATQKRILERQLATARRKASEQARTRLWAGGTAVLAAASLLGRKAVNVVTGGN